MSHRPGAEWRQAYRGELETALANGTLQQALDRLPEGAILLCHEADHCDCHRKVLAEFLNANGLAAVREFKRRQDEPDPQLMLL